MKLICFLYIRISLQKKIRYKNAKIKNENNNIKKNMFIPDVKIKIDQLKKINNVCPISG